MSRNEPHPGDEVVFDSADFRDETTARTVRRITPLDCRSHHQYFYLNMWTPDSRSVLVSSNFGDGFYRHYLVDVTSGRALCLTATQKLSSLFGELARDGSHLLYVSGHELRMRDLATMKSRTLYEQQEPWNGRSVYYGATADHSRAVMVEIQ